MKNRTKVIVCVISIMIVSIINIFFTVGINGILTNRSTNMEFISFENCFKNIMSDRQCLLLFLCFEGLIFVVCIFAVFINNKPYQSDLIEVTPNIKIPRPSGQFQHGSARFLGRKEKDSVFDSFEINSKASIYKQLIDTGYEDLDFINGRSEIEEGSNTK